MKKCLLCYIVFILVIPATIVSVAQPTNHVSPMTMGSTLYVGGIGPNNYTKIQDAVIAAVDGDIVFVFNGIYYENLYIKKSITLIGKNRDTTIIDGGGITDVARLQANHITFTGFTIQHGKENGIYIFGENITVTENKLLNNKNSDIWLSRSNNTISNNQLYGGGFGLYYYEGRHNTVTNNYIHDKPIIYLEGKNDTIITSDSGQIILVNCTNITIQNQTIQDISNGILLADSTQCRISQCTISNCFIGINFIRSTHNSMVSNMIVNNTAFGIQFWNSSQNVIEQNILLGSRQGAGVSVAYYSPYNIISNNTVGSNYYGIHISSSHTIIANNHIIKNDMGIGLYNASSTYPNDSASYSGIQGNIISEGDGITIHDISNCLINNNLISQTGSYGIAQYSTREITITNNTLLNNNWCGIKLEKSIDTHISENEFTNNSIGVFLIDSVRNQISRNSFSINQNGMVFFTSSDNTIEQNDILKNHYGMYLSTSDNNSIRQNNFKRNEQHGFFKDCRNSWDANYWNRLRFLPYPIIGRKTVVLPSMKKIELPTLTFDRNPAIKPYDISLELNSK